MDEYILFLREFGFPVFAFLLMFWMANSTIQKNTDTLLHLKDAIEAFSVRGSRK
jgi:hypothetical protein